MVRFHLLPPNPSWGYNSVGRVAALQAACRRFESDYLHQSDNLKHQISGEGAFQKGRASFILLLTGVVDSVSEFVVEYGQTRSGLIK